jgi:hypothetical protein
VSPVDHATPSSQASQIKRPCVGIKNFSCV